MAASGSNSFTLPARQRAVIANADGKPVINEEAPCPTLRPDQIFIRTEAVAINPSDTKMKGAFVTPFGLLGADYAGTVVAVGSEVTDVTAGDRVCGAQYAMHAQMPDRGAFGQYNVTNGKVFLKLPSTMSTEEGASLAVGISTAGLAIKALGLPLPDTQPPKKPWTVLVYGGSTATGTILIQLLKLAGLVPIATCSPKNNKLVESRGADKVFDYRDKDVANSLRAYTRNNMMYAVDCINTTDSMRICYEAIGRAGGKYVALDPYSDEIAATRKVVKPDWVLGPTIFGDGCTWPAPYTRAPDSELKQFGAELFRIAQKLIDEGKLVHHPLKVLSGGFEAVLEGLELVRLGKVSGEKVVVQLK